MATPASRIFVLYIDDEAVYGAATHPASAQVLDEVAARGVSGFLTLPDDVPQDKTLSLVLGADKDESFLYPKMPVAFISTAASACEQAKALGLTDVQLTSDNDRESTTSRIHDLLKRRDDPKAKQLVFFHLTTSTPSHWIYAVLDKIVGTEAEASMDRCFVSILRTAQRPHTPPAAAAHPLRPRQSYERHDGKYPAATSATSPRRLLLSSYHYDRTRRDLVTAFSEDLIQANGAYSAMDARIFMKELAFRLGFAPKYGA
ncbi:hypothetical protein Poli38472_009369 [Pythium oligandrum]|uniref:Uncharacterized protein n=1 Tax=Pythium oligandrum TaxID=41045 RepID=A0A8K1CMR1_PYTOL|nr:hypothetical protein Poli38472_009369 [Pythium oligandrum]|eukprot:TMW65202.1 hypothetical protein Poli38472_009369 [Pythium oligandrum]